MGGLEISPPSLKLSPSLKLRGTRRGALVVFRVYMGGLEISPTSLKLRGAPFARVFFSTGWLATRSANEVTREGWWGLAVLFRTFFDPDYATRLQK